MDTGGTMDPYIRICSQLFTAAHSSTHFKDFRYYYFHNCIYNEVYKDMERREKVSTDFILNTLETDYKNNHCRRRLHGPLRTAGPKWRDLLLPAK